MLKIVSSVIACFMVVSVQAQNLVTGHGVKVDTKEISEELERATAETKTEMVKSGALRATVSNIFVRRVLASEATQSAVIQNPMVLAAIEKAKERILSDAMLETIDQKNQPSLEAIEAYARSIYTANQTKFSTPTQLRASHILIRTAEPEALQKMQAILKQLKEGADFEELAKSSSQDPGSAAKGGDLGFFGKGRMIAIFENTVFAMNKIGEMSDVFESPFGYHIIKLTDKKPAGIQPFAEVKEQLMKEAQNEILTQGRLKEQDRILKDAKFNDAGFEVLEKSLTSKP
jgi:peptidyl-prolyl cis-trans isomerase C